MRGETEDQGALFYYFSAESRIPTDHPIRGIKVLADAALARLRLELDGLYAKAGRPSIPPEVLLKSQLLIALYSIRSERQFCERLNYDLLFRWFLDLAPDAKAFDATSFSKNRERLLAAEIPQALLAEVVNQARKGKLLSEEHFTVDGTLIEAAASMKSFKPKDPADGPGAASKGTGGKPPGGRNPSIDFRNTKRSNRTHKSTTDPQARLYRKGNGEPAQLAYLGHVLMENRNGLCVAGALTQATGTAEVSAALHMVEAAGLRHGSTLGADKGYDVGGFHVDLAERQVKAHISEKPGVYPLIDGRTRRSRGYQISQRKRKRVEEIFGWMKAAAGLWKTRFRGLRRVGAQFLLTLASYNLIRMAKLHRMAA